VDLRCADKFPSFTFFTFIIWSRSPVRSFPQILRLDVTHTRAAYKFEFSHRRLPTPENFFLLAPLSTMTSPVSSVGSTNPPSEGPIVYFRILGDYFTPPFRTTVSLPCSAFFDSDDPNTLVPTNLELLFLQPALDLMARSTHFKDAARKTAIAALTEDPTLLSLHHLATSDNSLRLAQVCLLISSLTLDGPPRNPSVTFDVNFGRFTPSALLSRSAAQPPAPSALPASILRDPTPVRAPTPAELTAAAAQYPHRNDLFSSGFVSRTSPTGIRTYCAAPAPFPGPLPTVANLDEPAARNPTGTLFTGTTPDGRATFRTSYSPKPDQPRTVRFPESPHPDSTFVPSPMSTTSTHASSHGSVLPPVDEWIELRPGEFLNPKETFDSIDIAPSGDLRYG
jgi:hypothetical protein